MQARVAKRMLKTRIVHAAGHSESISACSKEAGLHGGGVKGGQRAEESFVRKQSASRFRRWLLVSATLSTPRTSLISTRIVAAADSLSVDVRLVIKSDNPVDAPEADSNMNIFSRRFFQQERAGGRVQKKLQSALTLAHFLLSSGATSSVCAPLAV